MGRVGLVCQQQHPVCHFLLGRETEREEHNQCGCAKASFTLAIINLCQSERWRRRRQWPFYDPQHGTELLNSSSSSRPGLVQRKSADLCVLRGFFLLRFLPIVKVAEFSGLISATKVVIIAACNSGAGVINGGPKSTLRARKRLPWPVRSVARHLNSEAENREGVVNCHFGELGTPSLGRLLGKGVTGGL